jgi:hypothetical protein
VDQLRKPVHPGRIRSIPPSFSWIDREILHQRFLQKMSQEEMLLYFFLALVAGPQGTSFWSYQRIAKLLKLTQREIEGAIRSLVRKDLIAFRFPTFQVLALPQKKSQKEKSYQ